MIVTIAGTAGSGKSTRAKSLAEKLKMKHYSTGDFMRQLAEERGVDINGLSRLAESDESIDLALDYRQKKLGETQDNFVIDGRLAFHFIPKSVKIYLEADIKERARRIIEDIKRKEKNPTVDKTVANVKKREASEKKRYKEFYNLEINKDMFDLVVNTTTTPRKEVLNTVLGFLEKRLDK